RCAGPRCQPPWTAANTSTCAPSKRTKPSHALRGTTSAPTATATPRSGTPSSASSAGSIVPTGSSRGCPLTTSFMVPSAGPDARLTPDQRDRHDPLRGARLAILDELDEHLDAHPADLTLIQLQDGEPGARSPARRAVGRRREEHIARKRQAQGLGRE